MAHLFEHLMFGGSVNIPDFDGAIENAGGMNNAWTSNDYTNFYDIVPAQNVETAFWVLQRGLRAFETPEQRTGGFICQYGLLQLLILPVVLCLFECVYQLLLQLWLLQN